MNRYVSIHIVTAICVAFGGVMLWSDVAGPNIPLSPQNGGRSIAAAALKPADIVVSTTSKPLSAAIRRLAGTEVSHAILYVGDGTAIEAVAEGVTVRKLDEALGDTKLAVAFRRPNLTQGQAKNITDFAFSKLGIKFNKWGLVFHPRFGVLPDLCPPTPTAAREACLSRRGLVKIVANGENQFFCSALVEAAYRSANSPLTDGPLDDSTPGDVPSLSWTNELVYVGHLKI